MAERELKVGIGDMKFTRGDSRIITYALGSCIGITFYVFFLKLGGLLHIMLPPFAKIIGAPAKGLHIAEKQCGTRTPHVQIFGLLLYH